MFLEKDRNKILIAICFGILFCMSELLFSIFSIIALNVGGFFLIMFITGMISGRVRSGFLSVTVVLVGIIPLGFIFWPFFGMPLSMPEDALIGLLLVIATMTWKPFVADTTSDIGIVQFLYVLFIAPVVYIVGIFVAAMAGGLGGIIYRHFGLGDAPYPSVVTESYPQERRGL